MAATLPKPAEAAKISTHKTVGTARITATPPLIKSDVFLFVKFLAAKSPKNKAIIEPMTVVRKAKLKVISNCSNASA